MSPRSIESIYIHTYKKHVNADEFLRQDSTKVSHIRRRENTEFKKNEPEFRCSFCNRPVYLRRQHAINGKTIRVAHFAHRGGDASGCIWGKNTTSNKSEEQRNADKFHGIQEGELHKSLKNFVESILLKDPKFTDIKKEKNAVAGDKHSTRPDVSAMYYNKKIAFEIQLATTQAQTIQSKEDYNKNHNIHTLWIFHDFKNFKQRATSSDITDLSLYNAFELNTEAICKSRNENTLHFKAWWKEPNTLKVKDDLLWHSKLTSIHQLKWHNKIKKPFLFNFIEEDVILKRQKHAEFLMKFEKAWLTKTCENNHKIELYAYKRLPQILQNDFDLSLIDQNMFNQFCLVLDKLYELREGRAIFTKQNIKGRINTLLDNRAMFLNIIDAAIHAYDADEIINWDIYRKKHTNIENEGIKQWHTFNPIVRFLFPETATYLTEDI